MIPWGGSLGSSDCDKIYLTVRQPDDPSWLMGRTWGMRYWEPGTDRGGLIFIQKREVKMSQAVGPNRTFNKQKGKTVKGKEIHYPNHPRNILNTYK